MTTPLLRACVAPVLTSGAVTSHSSTAIDDLIVFVGWAQGTDQASISASLADATNSWLNHAHNDGTDDARFLIAVKKVTVAGAQSYTPWAITGATSGQISIAQYIVQAGTYDPAIIASLPAANISAASGTTNAVPNSPQLTPTTGTGWSYLFLSIGAWHITTAGTTDAGAPTSYTMRGENDPAVSHVTHLAITDRTIVDLAAAENPAGFTDNVAPNGTVACTVAITGYPPALSVAAGLATATSSALVSTVTPGGVAIAAGLATATSSGLDASASAGSAGLNAGADVAIGSATALAATVTPGAVAVAADVAIASSSGLAPTVTPGAVSVVAGIAIAASSGLGPTVTPGPVAAAAGLAQTTSSALDAGAAIVTLVAAGVADAGATALGATVTPGPVAVVAGVAEVLGGALGSTVTPGSVSAAAGLAGAASSGLDASAAPGGVAVAAGLATAGAGALDAGAALGSAPEAQSAAAGLAEVSLVALGAGAFRRFATAEYEASMSLNAYAPGLDLAENGGSLSLTDTSSSLTLDPS